MKMYTVKSYGYMKRGRVLLSVLVTGCLSVSAAIHNPVLPNVADAGVMKYNGKYYIGGVNTFGDFYVSEDLVKWKGPVQLLPWTMSGQKEQVQKTIKSMPMTCCITMVNSTCTGRSIIGEETVMLFISCMLKVIA